MFDKRITFDSFIRQLTTLALIVGAVFLVRYLRSVLLPFMIAWIVAYMLYPLVCFLQYRCRLRFRVLSIVAALVLVLAVVGGILWVVIPPTVDELVKAGNFLASLASQYLGDTQIADRVTDVVTRYFEQNSLTELIQHNEVQQALGLALTQLWNFVCQTVGFLMGLVGLFIIFLYLFFILMDYEKIADGWLRLVPEKRRDFCRQLFSDVTEGMNKYFRGQALIALLVGILFAIGFAIVGLPMGIVLGLFIGLLNLVPYLQLIGFVPTILCALMKHVETGQSFWVTMLWCLVVFAVVQTIQDFVLTPKIMGKAMGLRPAVILLSLSVWGSLMGVIGLIIALPLTTLCLSYYKRYVLHDEAAPPPEDK
ncbi:MAG: AI-2E family transporter [Prevotellaceae bacterium]|nr:AI-2E family transporter [Prevotellaceae bacterium]